jgi:glucose-6-phosphate isomerase
VKWSSNLGKLEPAVREATARLDSGRFSARLWERDGSLWKSDPGAQRQIKTALGWLTVGRDTLAGLETIREFAEQARQQGFKYAVLLGMGGSSLCPDVCAATFGTAPGFLELQVLDSTVPAGVLAAEKSVQLDKTLFIVSSKSGGTIETLSFYKYFYDLVRGVKGDAARENFVAITDPRTPLERLAREKKFRAIFPGAEDVGGRFSALSVFGMVPAALAGVKVKTLLERGEEMARACGPQAPAAENPGVALGAILGAAARTGRNKLTFVTSPAISTFGDWVEQLVAESTGKDGQGIVPVVHEYLGAPEVYCDDRIFVSIRLADDADERAEQQLRALEAAGHPVVRIELRDKLDLGAEFFRWEIATAAAGALLGINPFDQPNVAESKDNTARLLAEHQKAGGFKAAAPLAEDSELKLFAGASTRISAREKSGDAAVREVLEKFLDLAREGDYIALLPYLEPTEVHRALVRSIRMRLRDAHRAATTTGFGPRYLHSTGQLHKGGANQGLFLLITAEDSEAVPIPGEPYSFSVLKLAQALGDFQALEAKQRRVLRAHLTENVRAGLDRLLSAVEGALEKRKGRR